MDDYDFGIPAASRYAGERLGIDFTTPFALESIGVPFGRGNISINNPLANPNMFSGVRSLEDLAYTLDPSLSIQAQNLAGIQGLRAQMNYDLFGQPTFGINYNRSFGGPKRPDLRSFITDYTNSFSGSIADALGMNFGSRMDDPSFDEGDADSGDGPGSGENEGGSGADSGSGTHSDPGD